MVLFFDLCALALQRVFRLNQLVFFGQLSVDFRELRLDAVDLGYILHPVHAPVLYRRALKPRVAGQQNRAAPCMRPTDLARARVRSWRDRRDAHARPRSARRWWIRRRNSGIAGWWAEALPAGSFPRTPRTSDKSIPAFCEKYRFQQSSARTAQIRPRICPAAPRRISCFQRLGICDRPRRPGSKAGRSSMP